jgi:hypothetical protein
MFTSKKTKLFEQVSKTQVTNKSMTIGNAFVTGAMSNAAETYSDNGAVKYSTTGNDFVDQFGKISEYKSPRSFDTISKDMELLWSQDKETSVMFALYLRMITRKTNVFGTETSVSQKGAEMRHEGIMRMIWLHIKSPITFWKNVPLLVTVGSWKDIITMLKYDLSYNGWEGRKLDWSKFGKLILSGLVDDNQSNLVKKYLPQIKAKSACKTVDAQANMLIGKWICSLLLGTKNENSGTTYKAYRKLKTSGTAHEWQKLISQGKHQLIDFNAIHGRALNKLVRSKYLFNQGLSDKYEKWITKPETTSVKYTGFVHELFENLPYTQSGLTVNEITTINKQFDTLVEKAGETMLSSLIVVRDTSNSMSSTATGTTMSCYNLAKALALYFSEFLTGYFSDAWIEFNSNAKMHTWKGETPLDKWYNDKSKFVGSTNFESVIRLFATMKREGIAESEFPTGILCISDSEFNPSSLGKTNVDSAKNILTQVGFSKEYVDNFVIVLWNLQGKNTTKFETYGNTPNVFYLSGYSASVVSFLSNDIKTASELFNEAMNQEVLQMVEI